MNREHLKKNRWVVELGFLIILSIGFLFIGVNIISCSRQQGNEATVAEEEIVHLVEYGIIVDSLEVVRDKVKRNEFLSDILLDHGIDYALIDKIARSPRDIFDVRKIRVGYPYSVKLSGNKG